MVILIFWSLGVMDCITSFVKKGKRFDFVMDLQFNKKYVL